MSALVAPPVQPIKAYPSVGLATSETVACLSYLPSVMLTFPPSDAVTESCSLISAKFAVMFLFPLTVSVSGFVLPVTFPDQPVNSYPTAGVALIVTED